MPFNREARVRGAAECDYWPVQATPELMYCESPGPVPYLKGGGNCTTGEGGGTEKGGGREDGEGDERGEEGSVDGVAEGTRLGKKRAMSWILVEDGYGKKFSMMEVFSERLFQGWKF